MAFENFDGSRDTHRQCRKNAAARTKSHASQAMNDISHLLDTFQEGDPVGADQLLLLVYSELRRLAAAKISREARVR